MREMRWTWKDLQETPAYVRRFVWDCIQARHDAEEEQQRRQEAKTEGVHRVRR